MKDEISQGDPIASLPEQDKKELGLLGPDGEPIKAKLGKIDMPENDEGLCAIQILGRCSKCNVTGWIDYPGGKIKASDVDKLLSYKAVKCFCAGCRAMSEFLPIAYKKYPDVPMLKNLQDGFKIGKVK
jgi:hypothetical protein